MNIGLLGRRVPAAERTLLRGIGLQLRHQPLDHILPEPGADRAAMDRMIAAMNARHQRTEFSRIALPAAKHHLMASATFRFAPVHGARRAIRRIEALGDDALQRY